MELNVSITKWRVKQRSVQPNVRNGEVPIPIELGFSLACAMRYTSIHLKNQALFSNIWQTMYAPKHIPFKDPSKNVHIKYLVILTWSFQMAAILVLFFDLLSFQYRQS